MLSLKIREKYGECSGDFFKFIRKCLFLTSRNIKFSFAHIFFNIIKTYRTGNQAL